MTLDQYLTELNITEDAFAKTIGESQPTIHRYRKGRIPRDPDVMEKIVAATGGKVTPNDFFGLAAE
jgi:transcriptional regulator with XRE-family HTH domain